MDEAVSCLGIIRAFIRMEFYSRFAVLALDVRRRGVEGDVEELDRSSGVLRAKSSRSR
jgi:hypothetical protein